MSAENCINVLLEICSNFMALFSSNIVFHFLFPFSKLFFSLLNCINVFIKALFACLEVRKERT